MKKVTLIILLMVLTAFISVLFGQITTTKVAQKTDQIDNMPYDSTENFLGKAVYKYVGQELYLNGKSVGLREFGYRGFCLDFNEYTSNLSNTYKPVQPEDESYIKYDLGGGKSHYDSIVGKYFEVLEIIKHPKASENENIYGKTYFLKLQEKESKDIVYFEYDIEFEHSFPFIVVGFFEKQKSLVVGKEFVFADKVLEISNDIQSGKVVTTKTGQIWKSIDLTVEEEYYTLSLIIENVLGEKTTISHESVFGKWSYGRVYTANESRNYTKKFGQENFERILQGKVKIGMTREMCKLSWGEPKNIIETITSAKNSEQWVYSDNYLYFDNGILTAIQ